MALIQNARSHKADCGRKDIIKIDREMELDWDLIGYVDPSITVNSIRDGQLVEKRTLKLPERIRGVLRCKNPPVHHLRGAGAAPGVRAHRPGKAGLSLHLLRAGVPRKTVNEVTLWKSRNFT